MEIKKGPSGEGGDKFLRVHMLGGAEYLCWRATFDDIAGVEDGDAMAECGDGEQIVGYIKDSHAEFAVEAAEEGEDFGLGDGVESAGGFVSDEKGGAVKDGHGDDDALGLTNAELRGAAAEKIGVVGKANARKSVTDCSGALTLSAGSVSAPGFTELGTDTKSGIQRGQGALQNDADFAAAEGTHLGFGFCVKIFAFEKKIAAGGAVLQM